MMLVHGLPNGVEISDLIDDVDAVPVAEDPRDALASQIAVVCDEYAYRHRTPLIGRMPHGTPDPVSAREPKPYTVPFRKCRSRAVVLTDVAAVC